MLHSLYLRTTETQISTSQNKSMSIKSKKSSFTYLVNNSDNIINSNKGITLQYCLDMQLADDWIPQFDKQVCIMIISSSTKR